MHGITWQFVRLFDCFSDIRSVVCNALSYVSSLRVRLPERNATVHGRAACKGCRSENEYIVARGSCRAHIYWCILWLYVIVLTNTREDQSH
jgi:hypothetical protein